MWGGATTWQQLRGSISHLGRLNPVPEQPREHILVSSGSTHQLSISRENEITSNLAFLSAIRDDSLKVMAVCIEEASNGKEITIRIASNTGDLSEVTSGFKRLARSLEQAARREISRAQAKEAVFQHVVVLDLPRILSRLRSRHARTTRKTAGRPALTSQLSQILNDKSISVTAKFTGSQLEGARGRAEALQSLFTRLESIPHLSAGDIQVQEVVQNIVYTAHKLTEEIDLSEVIYTFTGDPSLKKYLPEAVGKLGRYYSAVLELVCAARDKACQMFQKIHVEPFQVAIPASVLEPLYKVHAEIQLLFFYELDPDRPRPRIICSSKSACYLCNLFFQIHGGFSVPRTHGRLYMKWILPDWLNVPTQRRGELGSLATQLQAVLENKIRIVSKSKKSICYHPNESILLPRGHWPSSSAVSSKMTLNPLASTSTLRPSQPFAQPGLSNSTNLPLTPPRTPFQSCAAARSDLDTIASRTIELTDYAGNTPSWENISLIDIGYSELPYSQFIVLTTPLLHLQLNELSLTLDFARVTSGHLSIEPVREDSARNKEVHVIDVKDIPTTTELTLDCPRGSNKLTIQLQSARKEFVCIKFVWDGPVIE
ncbi:hypothetical protein GLAREA_07275 [Glarea lozoyensis ATCC 20868]|uniref:Uncharacterized protein n=1 Tax=Glarea lozoyensis (strain ATCC 20868 / MF5171) TaxID=1116229 RepID=S3D701_GLAL2|nr:uncharacterized protein GLAREA_07275 [Glarea lozoyensis ATCC 20868]EPE34262.1 hypothetical protein GLAREA_07275 [Glarea lozoyensis ATCC 20868]